MPLAEYTTEPGVCDIGKHKIKDIEGTARLGYMASRLRWEGAQYQRRRLCKKHYLEEWREQYPGEKEPEL